MKIKKVISNRKYIDLKDGNNKPLIAGTIVCLVLLCLLCTSKLWFPDDRNNMNFKKGSEISMTLVGITLPKEDVLYDEEKNIVEFTLKEKIYSTDSSFKTSYKALSDLGVELPIQVIDGVPSQDTKVTVINQEKLIQIRVPEKGDFYYVKVVIEQKENVLQEFCIDYRNVKKVKILDKGKDYLKNQELEKAEEKGK